LLNVLQVLIEGGGGRGTEEPFGSTFGHMLHTRPFPRLEGGRTETRLAGKSRGWDRQHNAHGEIGQQPQIVPQHWKSLSGLGAASD
ncbi:MAG TPA: hypothetical protein VN677_13025, partial [Gemmatimonadaceae bacterium]|nr:hypothetical protein [Gemmatimonadaceae bacterium]